MTSKDTQEVRAIGARSYQELMQMNEVLTTVQEKLSPEDACSFIHSVTMHGDLRSITKTLKRKLVAMGMWEMACDSFRGDDN